MSGLTHVSFSQKDCLTMDDPSWDSVRFISSLHFNVKKSESQNIQSLWKLSKQIMTHSYLTVSVRSENFATVRSGFPEPNILIKWPQYFEVKIRHAYIVLYDAKVMSKWRKNLISGSFPEYSNYKNLFPVFDYTTKRCGIKFKRGSLVKFVTYGFIEGR